MPSNYSITEPHPTAQAYIHSGRGGAGNAFKAPKTTNGRTATGPASLIEGGLTYNHPKFSSGRGGAGNIHDSSEKTIFSFDEELERQTTREKRLKECAVHVGRGGAGNRASAGPDSTRKYSASSVGSNGSARSAGFFKRLSNTLERH